MRSVPHVSGFSWEDKNSVYTNIKQAWTLFAYRYWWVLIPYRSMNQPINSSIIIFILPSGLNVRKLRDPIITFISFHRNQRDESTIRYHFDCHLTAFVRFIVHLLLLLRLFHSIFDSIYRSVVVCLFTCLFVLFDQSIACLQLLQWRMRTKTKVTRVTN